MKIKNYALALIVFLSVNMTAQDAKAPAKEAPKAAPVVDSSKANNFAEAFTKGKLDVQLRLSYENSNVDNNASAAVGLSLRTRVGFRTAEVGGVAAYLQLHNNANAIEKFFDASSAKDSEKRSNRDVIADPQGSRIHQAYIDLTLIPDTTHCQSYSRKLTVCRCC